MIETLPWPKYSSALLSPLSVVIFSKFSWTVLKSSLWYFLIQKVKVKKNKMKLASVMKGKSFYNIHLKWKQNMFSLLSIDWKVFLRMFLILLKIQVKTRKNILFEKIIFQFRNKKYENIQFDSYSGLNQITRAPIILFLTSLSNTLVTLTSALNFIVYVKKDFRFLVKYVLSFLQKELSRFQTELFKIMSCKNRNNNELDSTFQDTVV